MNEKSILVFGAGKIGRAFIGQLFARAGYQVIFVDIDQEIVNELNRRKSYPVVIRGKKDETLLVENVRAVSGLDQKQVVNEIARSAIVATSAGKDALDKILPALAAGIKLRQELTPGKPIDVIIAENMRLSGNYFRVKLKELLPAEFPFEKMVGLVETSIGKMVPVVSQKDKKKDLLLVSAESYNTLILDRKGFRGSIPEVSGLSLKENIKAWVDRKAFIHNMGHATAAYLSHYFYPELVYLHEGLEQKNVFDITKKTMLQATSILIKYYPDDFTIVDLEEHVDDLLLRFQNRALHDTVFRVGQDLMRKLDIDDRFGGIIQMARFKNLEYQHISKAMAYGFFFKASDEQGRFNPKDRMFHKFLKNKGVEETLKNFCRFQTERDKYLLNELAIQFEQLKVHRDVVNKKFNKET